MFKIGDRVRVIKNDDYAKVGMVGTIKYQGALQDVYGVEFDTAFQGGHGCRGHAKEGHGQWVDPECLELIKPKAEKIVITHDGKTTLARLYEDNKVVKSAEAKCSPDDEFDFLAGAKLAFERLTEEKKEPPFKVGDVVKVKAATYHLFMDGTLGRVVGLEGKDLEVKAYRPNQDDIIRQFVRAADCEKVK